MQRPSQYVLRPVSAIRWDGENADAVAAFIGGGSVGHPDKDRFGKLNLNGLSVPKNHWVVREGGNFKFLTDKDFEATYEPFVPPVDF